MTRQELFDKLTDLPLDYQAGLLARIFGRFESAEKLKIDISPEEFFCAVEDYIKNV